MMQDPFDIPGHLIPPGTTYQWCSEEMLAALSPDWEPVPVERMLDAGFNPNGGVIPVKLDKDGGFFVEGQKLMQRPKVATDAAHAEMAVKAEKSEQDALDKIQGILR